VWREEVRAGGLEGLHVQIASDPIQTVQELKTHSGFGLLNWTSDAS
jgi:hypothetical protein